MNPSIIMLLSSQAIPFILGIVVLVILLFLRFYKIASTQIKENKQEKPDQES